MRWNSSRSTSAARRLTSASISVGAPAVRLLRGQIEQLAGVAQAALEAVQAADDLLEFGAFLAEFLRALRVVPDARLLEFARLLPAGARACCRNQRYLLKESVRSSRSLMNRLI